MTAGVSEKVKEVQSFFKDMTKTADEIKLDKGVKELKRIEEELGYLGKEYQRMQEIMKTNPIATVRQEAQQDMLAITNDLKVFQADYKKVAQEVKDLQGKISDISGFKRMVLAIKNTSKVIQKEIKNKAIKTISEFNKKLRGLDYKKGFEAVNRGVTKMEEVFRRLKRTISSIPTLLAGVGLSAGMKKLFELAKTMDVSFNAVQIRTDLSGVNLNDAKKSVQAIYNKGLGSSLDEVTNAVISAHKLTGVVGKDLDTLAENALHLAKGFNVGIEESIQSAQQLAKNFNMTYEEAFSMLVQGTKVNEEFIETAKEYSKTFSAIGLSGSEMISAITKATRESGAEIEDIGKVIESFQKHGMKLSNSAAEGFYLMGKSVNEMVSRLSIGGNEAKSAFKEIIRGLKGIKDPVRQNAAGIDLFGEAWNEVGKTAILALGEIEAGTASSVKQLNELKRLNLSDINTQIERIIRPIKQEMGLEILKFLKENGSAIKDTVTKVLNVVLKGLRWIVKHQKKILKFGKLLLKIAIGFTVLSGIVKTIKLIGTAITLLTNPITWVVAGIAAIGFGIYELVKHWDKVKETFKKAGKWMWDKFIGPVVEHYKTLWKVVKIGVYELIKQWDKVKEAFKNAGKWMWDKFIGPVIEHFKALGKVIKMIGSWIYEHIITPIQKALGLGKAGKAATTATKKQDIDLRIGGTDLTTLGDPELLEAIERYKHPDIPGMAKGGVFEANNPFLAVLGDQQQGTNIEAPESLLRDIIRDENAGNVNTYSPVFNISVNGSMDSRRVERKIKEIFKRSMEEYVGVLMRQSPRVTSI